jgi:hypothetical protein
MRQRGELEAIMLHRYLSEDTHEERPLSDMTIIMGIVAVCVFLALILLGAGMLNKKSLTQPSTQAPVATQSDSQAPAIPQPSTQSPGAGENTKP